MTDKYFFKESKERFTCFSLTIYGEGRPSSLLDKLSPCLSPELKNNNLLQAYYLHNLSHDDVNVSFCVSAVCHVDKSR